MRKVIISVGIGFISCNEYTGTFDLENVLGKEGMLYYEKPETGSIVYAVFVPFNKKHTRISQNITSHGIKFNLANSKIKDSLYSYPSQKIAIAGCMLLERKSTMQ